MLLTTKTHVFGDGFRTACVAGSFIEDAGERGLGPFQTSCYCRAELIDRIKFDFSTAVARRLKPSRATAV